MRQATDIAAVSLYSGEHDRRAVTLWEVSWRQPISLAEPVLDQPDFYLGEVDISPADAEAIDG